MRSHNKSLEASLVDYGEALNLLSTKLLEPSPKFKIGSFGGFVRDIWSQGYSNPQWFESWHIQLICDDIELAMSEGKYYACLLPRYHLKSTVLGYAFSVWNFLTSGSGRFDSNGMYLSYSDRMSLYHMSEIKKAIRRNDKLREWMKDRAPDSDYLCKFEYGGHRSELLHGGVFSFKRGTHVNGFLVADDILRDPANPLDLNQLVKVEEHFMTETIHIPVGKAMVVLLGTPLAPNDLLAKVREDERFKYRFLSALDPIPGKRVLCPAIRNEEQLLTEQKIRPRSFASEMMLQPYWSTDSYIGEEEIRKVENPDLSNLDPYSKNVLDSDYTVAGFDVGKKRHPSHISVYTSKNGRLKQIYQAFLDEWPYVDQVYHLNLIANNFGIDKGYIDNTRGELEERGLNDSWKFLNFTAKKKRMMAQGLEDTIHNNRLEMISNERQRTQITCVNSELDAPETPLGHGDSFWSNALAVLAFVESSDNRTQIVGDIQDMVVDSATKKFIAHNPQVEYNKRSETPHVCPTCGESAGFIPENSLCLICGSRS